MGCSIFSLVILQCCGESKEYNKLLDWLKAMENWKKSGNFEVKDGRQP